MKYDKKKYTYAYNILIYFHEVWYKIYMLIISYFIFIMMDVKIYVVIMVASQIADSQFTDSQIADIWKILLLQV
jgi:hypothetical protein